MLKDGVYDWPSAVVQHRLQDRKHWATIQNVGYSFDGMIYSYCIFDFICGSPIWTYLNFFTIVFVNK